MKIFKIFFLYTFLSFLLLFNFNLNGQLGNRKSGKNNKRTVSESSNSLLSGKNNNSPYGSISLLMDLVQTVRKYYVDEEKVDYQTLFRGAMKGMLHELDPFSSYLDPESHKRLIGKNQGSYGGIGVVISFRNNMLEIIAPMEGGPAFKAGILPGDIITNINGISTKLKNMHECIQMMKGEAGTEVSLTIYRKSDDSVREFTIERKIIKLGTVKGEKIIENGIAYVRITQFSAETSDMLEKALEKLRKNGMKSLVLDLRGNPGGLLLSAIQVASLFIPEDELIVFTRGRSKENTKEFKSLDCEKFDIPLAILIDKNSASASEIVAACLQDHKRAVLIGEKSFGKGSVQAILPLPKNQGSIRLTTAKYYTPSEKLIHGHGIEPDILIELSPATKGILTRQRSTFPGVTDPEKSGTIKDEQLEKAVDVLNGVRIFNSNKNI